MSIGEALEHARHQAGLTIAEISQRTRIRERLIRGIEHDDFSGCGGDFYARGHIRSIARMIGIDPEPLIQEYDRVWREPDTIGSAVQRLVTESRATLPDLPAAEPSPARRDFPAAEPPPAGWDRPRGEPPLAGRDFPPAEPPPAEPPPAGPAAWGTGMPPASPGGWPGQLGSLPPRPVIPPRRPRRNLILPLAAAAVVLLGVIGYVLLSASGPAAPAGSAAAGHPATSRPAAQGRATPARPTASPSPPRAARTSPAASPARVLAPVSAAAFGPGGAGAGDNANLAHLAVDGSRATAWHTDWYTSPTFGNLYPGTGLLLDLGRRVTITGVQLDLGAGHGGQLEIRAGSQPALGSLRTVASTGNAGGQVRLRPRQPASGRYLLIWFTRLPLDPAGTFQASVHDVTVTGRP